MISPPSLLTSFLLLKIPIMGKRGRQQGKRRSESPSRGPGKESQDEEEGERPHAGCRQGTLSLESGLRVAVLQGNRGDRVAPPKCASFRILAV